MQKVGNLIRSDFVEIIQAEIQGVGNRFQSSSPQKFFLQILTVNQTDIARASHDSAAKVNYKKLNVEEYTRIQKFQMQYEPDLVQLCETQGNTKYWQ